jgi:hypothetical protein
MEAMSDVVKVALISAASTALPSLLAAFFSYRASRHAKLAVQIATQTEENTNHMKDELVALTAKSSHAEGVLEGKSQQESQS